MAASTVALVLAAAALLGVAVLCVVLVVALRSERRRTTALLTRLTELADPGVPAAGVGPAAPPMSSAAAVAEFVITDLGVSRGPVDAIMVTDRVVLSAALGEPLVRGLALAHGLRRALSAESRNRIRFEVRREVRRSRRRRKQEMKEAWRQVRAEDGTAA
jgi:hypothetical protein